MSSLRQVIETAIAEGRNAVDVREANVPAIRDALSRYNDFTSRACYTWQASRGLARVDLAHIATPNTASFESALKRLDATPHFGIYLFENVRDEFKVVSSWSLLRKLVANMSAQRKIMLFAGEGLALPDHMQDLFLHVTITPEAGSALTESLRYA